ERHGARDPARRHGPHLRSVLHHEARGRGDRARPVHQLRDREEARRRHPGRQPGGRWGELHRPAAADPAKVMGEAPTVLLVDDEPRVLDSLEAMLGMDYRILRTERPAEALALLARERVAVIISDQRMPQILGTDLLTKSLEVSPETVRILLTAFTDADALMA